MTFPTPHTLRVRTRTEGDLDDFGNATATTSEHDWPVCFIAPGAIADVDDGTRDLSRVAYSIGAPKNDLLPSAYDSVLVDGEWLNVNGIPKDYTRGPWGFSPGVVVELEVAHG